MTETSKRLLPRAKSLATWLSGVCLVGLGLISCGGGGGVDTGGTGATAGYSSGPITGFGSIVVNGVHFDESSASVFDDDGTVLNSAALKLGMTVQIDSGTIDATALTATASVVRVHSDLLGPVQAINATASTFTVLGQPVQVTQSTLFDASLAGGLSALTTGQVVEVYAMYDAVAGSYAARLVEPASASAYKLRGQVQQVNTSAHTFQVGTEVFSYGSGSAPAALVNGATLLLKLKTARDANLHWVLNGASEGHRTPSNGTEVELEAVVSSYSSLASFVVNGVTVNASAAQISPSGATLAAGQRVEVEGVMTAGVLQATKLEIKGGQGSSGGDDEGQGQEFEIRGVMSALDAVAKTFVIRSQTISYGGNVNYDGGSAADLAYAYAQGRTLEVKGNRAAGGTVVQAEQIKFKSN
jgi:hypothetical protein